MKTIFVKTRQEVIRIPFDDIYYICCHPSKAHHIQVLTKDREYDFVQNLSALEKLYPEVFIRCHRNCLVNPSKIRSVTRQDRLIYLGEKGEYKVTYARRRYSYILQEWLKKGGL